MEEKFDPRCVKFSYADGIIRRNSNIGCLPGVVHLYVKLVVDHLFFPFFRETGETPSSTNAKNSSIFEKESFVEYFEQYFIKKL